MSLADLLLDDPGGRGVVDLEALDHQPVADRSHGAIGAIGLEGELWLLRRFHGLSNVVGGPDTNLTTSVTIHASTTTDAGVTLAVEIADVTKLDVQPGELPEKMAAWVIRPEREGEPKDAFQVEEIEVPEPGAFEVIVRVMAAGVNFNNVWAALGKPVSVFGYGDHEEYGHHIGGSDASGVVWKVGEGVTKWKPGDEVVIHCNQASYEDVEVHGLDPLAAPSQRSGATRRPGAPSPSSPRSRPSSSCPSPRTSPGRSPRPTASPTSRPIGC